MSGNRNHDPAVAELLEVATIACCRVQTDLAEFLESACLLNDDLSPRRDTLTEDEEEYARELESLIARMKAAIFAVRGGSTAIEHEIASQMRLAKAVEEAADERLRACIKEALTELIAAGAPFDGATRERLQSAVPQASVIRGEE